MTAGKKTAKLQISNYVNGVPLGDYVAQIELGPEKSIANVLLDTGSSTLAVWQDKFGSAPVIKTHYIQFVEYGTGHWAGPVLKAQVGMGTGSHYIELPDAFIAQIQSGSNDGHKQFYPADGILGLAYRPENLAADAGTTSFPITQYDSETKWNKLISAKGNSDPLPTLQLPPYFNQLVNAGDIANKFAFMTCRSLTRYSAEPATDPINKGWFILGGGEEHTELYTGQFQVVKEIADSKGQNKFYNINLTKVQVGNNPPVDVQPTSSSQFASNALIDSGSNTLGFTPGIYYHVLTHLGLKKPVKQSDLLDLPTLFVTFEGVTAQPVTLAIKPQTYWQIDSLTANSSEGQTSLRIVESTTDGLNIFGLPLMNNYYVVFDRSVEQTGVVKFAQPNFANLPT